MLVSGNYSRFYSGISAYGSGRLHIADNIFYSKEYFEDNQA